MDAESPAEPSVAISPGLSTSFGSSSRKKSRKNGIMAKTEASAMPMADARPLDKRIARRREELVAQRRKELAELMEHHDNAVREAFHLDRFVTLTSFDPEVAKSDTSQVFESFRARYDLVINNIENASGSGATGRRTRRAINDKRQSMGVVSHASSSLAPVPSVPSPKVSKGKGKETSRSAPLSSPTGARPKTIPALRDVPPKKGRKSLPSYLDTPAPPSVSPSSARGRSRGRGKVGRGGGIPRRKSLGTIVRGRASTEVDELESEEDLVLSVAPVLRPAISRPKKPRKYEEIDTIMPPAPTIKRIKLIHRVPPPVYTHHQQPPPDKAHGGNVTQLLQPYVRMEDDGPEMTVEELEAVARTDGAYLRRIKELRAHGRLSHVQGSVPKAPEPSRPLGHWDSVIERVFGHLKVVRENARARVSGARRVARLINTYWEKVAGADEKVKRLEEKKMQALVKSTMKAVQAQWKDAVKYVKQKKLAQEKEEQARRGKEHLDAIIEHSAKALEAQRSLDISGFRDLTDIEESQHESDTSLGDDEDEDDLDSQTSHDDRDLEDEEVIIEEDSTPNAEIETSLEAGEEDTILSDDSRERVNSAATIQGEDSPIHHGSAGSRGSSLTPMGSFGYPSSDLNAGYFSTSRRVSFVDQVVDMEDVDSPALSGVEDSPNGHKPGNINVENGQSNHGSDSDSSSPVEITTSPTLPPNGKAYTSRPPTDAEDGEFLEHPLDDAEDFRLAAEMEAEGSDSDDDEMNTLEQEAELPLEELLSRYGYVPNTGHIEDGSSVNGEELDDASVNGNHNEDRVDQFVPDVVPDDGEDVTGDQKELLSPTPEAEADYPDALSNSLPIVNGEKELIVTVSGHSTSGASEKADSGSDAESSGDDLPSLSHLVNRDNPDETIKAPFLLRGTLRPYQQAGLEWLVTLYRNGNNGILADEMGLGKTIQTIALLGWLACERGNWGPHLIIVPTSVLKNWEMEFKKFLPGFKILSYYGTTKERKERRHGWKAQHAFNVCVTSYQLILADQHIFRRMPWVYMILDEAHNIKNFKSQRWQDLFTFRSDRRLLLTGTPLQNNLMELWALMHFLNPIETVGYRSDFADWFSRPMDRALEEGNAMAVENQERVNKLHTMLRPYLLRRMKVDVEKELPAKYEHMVYCKLSKRQRYLYDEFMSRSETKEVLASGNFLSVVNCLMQLRKVCNHPDLFEVRPIVTSFAMTKSAIADYEIKELLVRKRLLETDHLDTKHSVLHHLTSYEDTSVVAYLSRRMLDATFHLPGQRLQPGEPPPVDLRTIEGYRRFRQYRENESKRLRWKHIAYINRVRCSARPVYGREKLDCVQAMLHPMVHSDSSGEVPSRGWDCSTSIPSMVKSYGQRAEAMRPIIDRFAFATPPVVTLDLPSIALRPLEKSVAALQSDVEFDTLHPVAVKLQIAFPDPSLLQYDCGKLQQLDALLKEKRKGGHRALIFTQMTRVLDILEIFLNFHGYRYLRLDGSTKIEDRQRITQRFNVDTRILAFISSSRSGGVGINLTGADTVIFYDSDYNPSMDRQCEDRAHRIGQVRDVHIYRFISKHTVEESMLRKADQKRSLDDIVIRQGDFDWRKVMVSDMQMVQALEQVEEAEDAQAARNAAAEMNLDTVGEQGDFGEAENIKATPNEPGEEAEQEEDVEEELESLSGVERHMVRFVERDWAFFSEWRVK